MVFCSPSRQIEVQYLNKTTTSYKSFRIYHSIIKHYTVFDADNAVKLPPTKTVSSHTQ